MRLQELFLVETTEEDRAIISLSKVLYSYLQQYTNSEPKDGTHINVGSIGELFDTPVEILNSVDIQLQTSNDIWENLLTDEEKKADIEAGKKRNIHGAWSPENNMIVFNLESLPENGMKSVITHELRHALDDYKSDFRAGNSKRYFTPKNKKYKKISKDPYAGAEHNKMHYLSQPGEINARFSEVLHGLVAQVQHSLKHPEAQRRDRVLRAMKDLFRVKHIAELFPEKEKSSDYKRLMKRAVDFIDKELEYARKQSYKTPR